MIPPEQNGEFVARMEKVLDVYKRPYDPEYPVVSMDESPKQLIRETRNRSRRHQDERPELIMNMGDAAYVIFSWRTSLWQASVL